MTNKTPYRLEDALYVHIPFCAAKCHYCDFNSYAVGKKPQAEKKREIAAYLAALLLEAELYAKNRREKAGAADGGWASLYLGGGTPTVLAADQLACLLGSLRRTFPLISQAEVTVEANPGTIDAEKLKALREYGVNRLSLGAQSFIPRELQVLGRIHGPKEIHESIRLAKEAGFENINLDLMYGLPGQTRTDWRNTLRAAVDLSPEHVSLYQLNIEKGTPFFSLYKRGLLAEFAEDEAFFMYQEAIDTLAAAGYHHYEISNFARTGRESRHNRTYWQNRGYLGLGAGASGYVEGRRYTNLADPAAYTASIDNGLRPLEADEVIDRKLEMAETMFLGLRLLAGVSKEEFFLRHGTQLLSCYGEAIIKLKRQGLLEETEDCVRLSRRGLFVANRVMIEFL